MRPRVSQCTCDASIPLYLPPPFAGMLKGVMRVGAFARGLLLKGECDVELILMLGIKPNSVLFNDLASRIPTKFEVCAHMKDIPEDYPSSLSLSLSVGIEE